MKTVYTLLLGLLMSTSIAWGQSKPSLENRPLQSERMYTVEELAAGMQALPRGDRQEAARQPLTFEPRSFPVLIKPTAADDHWRIKMDPRYQRPHWIEGHLSASDGLAAAEQIGMWLAQLSETLGVVDPATEFRILGMEEDELGQQHWRVQQEWQGVPVYGGELVAHFRDGHLYLLNGQSYPSPELDTAMPNLSEAAAIEAAKEVVGRHSHFKELADWEHDLIEGQSEAAELIVFHPERDPAQEVLAWEVNLYPHLGEHWQVILDAQTGELIREMDHICHFLPPPDGPEVTTATDLLGQTRTIHSYELAGNNYLIDASRTMFDGANSAFPNDAIGVVWTIDANNTSPANDNFNTTHVVSSGNFWNDPLAVSAHYNAGEAYRYFEETFNRNSINGQGGNVVSLINVSEDDGSDMDNAFWNGFAMFYGNGNQAFTAPLAKALDVAGHEISHGVIQNSANLEYMGESGALNESFADIFGAMIDRDDWQMGEEVVNTAIFSTGALRDLSNPNNGGNQLGDPGWQPAHTNEQYFGSQNNGGVHINSGIPNRAFYLLATAIGKDKAERIYYRALTVYLTRSSQFIDLRNAVIQAAEDLYGNTEVNAAVTAFNTVGIGSGGGTNSSPTDPFQDLAVNPGEEYILFSNGALSEILIQRPDGTLIANPLTFTGPLSKPTMTDDGSAVVYVAQDQTIRAVLINWQTGDLTPITISSDPVWRNCAISRDGLRLAAITDDYVNEILIFDLEPTAVVGQAFELYNPTFTEGVSTGDVVFADVLEWDHSGEYVLYDALNEIANQGGNIDYWDIGFLEAWNNNSSDFGNGIISKLIPSLPENTSVGNPTFSKNSPYIIAFDFIDNNDQTYFLLAGNTETGEIGTLFQNNSLSYPNYSNQDDILIFDYIDEFGFRLIAEIELNEDKITAASTAFIFIENGNEQARWGVWFANGFRDLVGTDDLIHDENWVKAYPTVVQQEVTLVWEMPQAAEVQVMLTSLSGQVIWEKDLGQRAGPQQETLSLPNLPAGSYVLSLTDGQRIWTQQLMKL